MKSTLRNSLKFAAVTAFLLFDGTSLASANTINVGDGATGTGPYDLVANGSTPDSYVQVILSSTVAFNSITSLSANFTDLLGGAAAGSPRFKVRAVGGDYFDVYLAPPFSNTDAASFTAAFNNKNLVNGDGNTGHQDGAPYLPFSDWQTNALYSGYQIDAISFILEDNSGVDQHLTLNGISLNGTNLLAAATTPVPEPVTLSLFGAGLAGAVAMRRRKKKS